MAIVILMSPYTFLKTNVKTIKQDFKHHSKTKTTKKPTVTPKMTDRPRNKEKKIYLKPTANRGDYNRSDLDLMARIINAEAGGGSDLEQLLVGNVVMNRVKSKQFPNSIREVIYQPGQYSPTWNGAIDKIPTKRAYKNAKRILNGERFCPDNVIWQAMFVQGKGIYKEINGTYFCY